MMMMMMSSKRKASTTFLMVVLSLLAALSSFTTIQCKKESISIYWGQSDRDGSLSSTCDSENYEIVLISSLNVFGCGQALELNLTNCGGSKRPCNKLQSQIEHCQEVGVKVFLSIGGATGDYSLCSQEEAKEVAIDLYNKFFTGKTFGPLGKVKLDGLDLDIQLEDSTHYWENLVQELDARRGGKKKKFLLSAAPLCDDSNLKKAIKTGLFDYVFVKFYNDPACQYDAIKGDLTPVVEHWNLWTSLVLPNNSVYLGLPASPEAAPGGGYIPPDIVTTRVFTFIKPTPNYGGVNLWDRHFDIVERYSDEILEDDVTIKANSRRFDVVVADAISSCVSKALRRFWPLPGGPKNIMHGMQE